MKTLIVLCLLALVSPAQARVVSTNDKPLHIVIYDYVPPVPHKVHFAPWWWRLFWPILP